MTESIEINVLKGVDSFSAYVAEPSTPARAAIIAIQEIFGVNEEQARVQAGLDSHPKVTIHDYQGLDHGFAAQSGSRRNEQGARLADSRTAAFFAEHLG